MLTLYKGSVLRRWVGDEDTPAIKQAVYIKRTHIVYGYQYIKWTHIVEVSSVHKTVP